MHQCYSQIERQAEGGSGGLAMRFVDGVKDDGRVLAESTQRLCVIRQHSSHSAQDVFRRISRRSFTPAVRHQPLRNRGQ